MVWGFTGNPDHCFQTENLVTISAKNDITQKTSQVAMERCTDSEILPSEAKSHQSDSMVVRF